MADVITNRGKYRILNAFLSANDVRMCAFTGAQPADAAIPDLNTVADLDAVTSVAIHTERLTLSGETVTEDDTNDRAAYDSANAVFAAAAGVTAQGVAIYDEGSGTDATRDLIVVYKTGFPQPMDGGLTINVADLIRAS